MQYPVEEVFRTEGVPEFTFVKPPNFNEILVDIRNEGKPTIIEGQSGTGKTAVAKKIIEKVFPHGGFDYLSARTAGDMPKIIAIAEGKLQGKWIIDDFHRLDTGIQEQVANLIKVAAEDFDPAIHPKLVLIGINKVGSSLIYLVHDIAKRCGIHRILPGDSDTILKMIVSGEEKLNIILNYKEAIFDETKGDYWLTQLTCQNICLNHDVLDTQTEKRTLEYSKEAVRERIVSRLDNSYKEPVKEFCRGKRFRPTNDPYFRLLRLIGTQESSIVDLNELANANPGVKGSINNIKERRISIVLESKPICERYFYYTSDTKTFAIEDPAFFYYLKHLDWNNFERIVVSEMISTVMIGILQFPSLERTETLLSQLLICLKYWIARYSTTNITKQTTLALHGHNSLKKYLVQNHAMLYASSTNIMLRKFGLLLSETASYLV